MDANIRKPNRTYRSNKKRIVSKFKDFEDFDYIKKQSKSQRKLKKKYARAAKQNEKEFLEKEIDKILNN